MSKLLLVEDDRNIQDFNRELLEEHGHSVTLAFSLAQARKQFAAIQPDLIVLDVMLPDGSGFDWLAELRQASLVPVLMLTAKRELDDKLQGFDIGADDYLPKPYDYEELVARVHALLRRTEHIPELITYGPLSIDTVSKQALLHGKDLLLTPKDFSLLQFFVQNKGSVMEAQYVYEKVWGRPMQDDSSAVRMAASRLRRKLKGSGYTITLNKQNDGYCFKELSENKV